MSYLCDCFCLQVYSSDARGTFQPFNATNLRVEIFVMGVTWTPGMNNSGNLLGTVESLDGVTGTVDLNCHNRLGLGLGSGSGSGSGLGLGVLVL